MGTYTEHVEDHRPLSSVLVGEDVIGELVQGYRKERENQLSTGDNTFRAGGLGQRCHPCSDMGSTNLDEKGLHLFFFLILFIYLFIYGCVGSSFLCKGFL